MWKRALPKEIIALGVREMHDSHQQFKIIKTLDQTATNCILSHQKKHRKLFAMLM
jgi:hypothetical protein